MFVVTRVDPRPSTSGARRPHRAGAVSYRDGDGGGSVEVRTPGGRSREDPAGYEDGK